MNARVVRPECSEPVIQITFDTGAGAAVGFEGEEATLAIRWISCARYRSNNALLS